MQRLVESPQTIVIDANLAIWALVPCLSTIDAFSLVQTWQYRRVRLLAPELWLAEVTSAIQRYIKTGALLQQEGVQLVQALLGWGVETASHAELCLPAIAWANRLGQSKTYDALYVALAEREGAELWTGDQRLANAAQQAGAPWVRWAGKASPESAPGAQS
jgi:predicted nucleic acid-binding protein